MEVSSEEFATFHCPWCGHRSRRMADQCGVITLNPELEPLAQAVATLCPHCSLPVERDRGGTEWHPVPLRELQADRTWFIAMLNYLTLRHRDMRDRVRMMTVPMTEAERQSVKDVLQHSVQEITQLWNRVERGDLGGGQVMGVLREAAAELSDAAGHLEASMCNRNAEESRGNS